jgi:hypothetical protein
MSTFPRADAPARRLLGWTGVNVGRAASLGCLLAGACFYDYDGAFAEFQPPPTPPAEPACDDDVRNGDETDVDCGGPKCADCALGERCDGDDDCVAGECLEGLCLTDPIGVWVERDGLPLAIESVVLAEHDGDGVLLFGGGTATSTCDVAETWRWDGETWEILAYGPSARQQTDAAYDRTRGRLILYGGVDIVPIDDCNIFANNALFADTWSWDGTAWEDVSAAAGAPMGIRLGHALAYDEARDVIVLAGGNDDMFMPQASTWEWRQDGTPWQQGHDLPAAVIFLRMVYDGERLVAFGGAEFSGPDAPIEHAEVWELHDTGWQERVVPSSPPARWGHAMAFDRHRGRVIVFGGVGESGPLDDTWELDGNEWRSMPIVGEQPPPSTQNAMAYDSTRRRAVLHVGSDGANWIDPTLVPTTLGETWEYFVLATPCTSGADCGSGECVDGLCCDRDCGTCEACNTPASPGQCAAVTSAEDDDSCTSGFACDAQGDCVATP